MLRSNEDLGGVARFQVRAEPEETAREELVAWVEKQGFIRGGGRLVTDPWQVLSFSSVCSVQRLDANSKSGVFIKIPKADFQRREVLPVCEDDRQMAREEYRSLVYLEKHWPNGGRVRYVQPLGLCRRYSAIVTRRSYGEDMFLSWRQHDLLNRVGLDRGDPVSGWLTDMGKALRGYHEASAGEQGRVIERRLGDPVAKIRGAISYLGSRGASVSGVARLAEKLRQAESVTIDCPGAMTLKGLDLRNLLLEQDQRLTLLDPGRLKLDDPVADLARFIATCRILYWGGGWWLLGLRPSQEHEAVLRRAYGTIEPERLKLYDLYLVKELLKQWVAAYVAIDGKNWPEQIKRVVRRTYVDRFYRKEAVTELARVTG